MVRQWAARSSDPADVEIEIDLAALDELTVLASDGDPEAKRARLFDAAEAMGAFGPEAFGHDEDDDASVSEDDAMLVAGAVIAGLGFVATLVLIRSRDSRAHLEIARAPAPATQI